MEITTKVRDVMTSEILSLETDASAKEALELMVKNTIGPVIVTKNGKRAR